MNKLKAKWFARNIGPLYLSADVALEVFLAVNYLSIYNMKYRKVFRSSFK